MRQNLFRIQNGYRSDHDIKILTDINIELQYGEIQGIFFDNHKEEEALIQVLSGAAKLDGGCTYYRERFLDISKARKRLKEKVFLPAFQTRWGNELTVADFFCLHQKQFFIRRTLYEQRVHTLLQIFGIELSPESRMQQLSDGQKVLLELVRAYDRGYAMVILRGLSVLLGEAALTQVRRLLDKLRERNMAFLVLDHAGMLARFCTADIYEVNRGQTVYVYRKEELLPYLMLQQREKHCGNLEFHQQGEILQVRGVLTASQVQLNFSVFAGELVTIFDTVGLDVSYLGGVLSGELPCRQGSIWFRGQSLTGLQQHQMVHKGIGMIEEQDGAYEQQLFYHFSALENLELLMAEKEPGIFMKKKRRESIIKESAVFFSETELLSLVSQLEPWQRQRLLYYRWYLFYPQLVICIRPLTSLDRQMRKETERMIGRLLERGIAVLVLTANKQAAETLGGRCIVISEAGKLKKN